MAAKFKVITAEAMKKLVPGKELREGGIVFIREGNGDGCFKAELMVYGERIHRVIGRESDGTTRTTAFDFVDNVRNDAKNDRLSLPRGRKIAMSFEEAALQYLEKLPLEGGKDMVMKRSRLTLHLIPFFGKIRLDKISGSDIATYKHMRINEKSQRGGDRVSVRERTSNTTTPNSSVGTVNRELAVLSHVFSKAVDWKWLTHAPTKIVRFREDDGRKVYLTVAEVQRFVAATLESENPHLYPFVLAAIGTSMRMSEILSIRKENVDIAKRIIYIPKAKAGQREQPITAELASFLAPYLETSPLVPWLFPSPASASGHVVDIRKPWLKAVVAAGLNPRLVIRHTLRHTAITHLVQAGVDLPTVKRISGHKTMAMVEKYSHQNGEHIAAAMDIFEQRMRSIPNGSRGTTQELHETA